MTSIQFCNLIKRYGTGEKANQVLHGVNAEIRDGEFVVIVGPSGCGKSTLLRMVAGLEDVSDGEIRIGGEVVNQLEPAQRDIAMVFQNYALYPHMTVQENMAYGLKIRKTPKEEIQGRVEKAAKILGLSHLLQRKPRELSGGQRQRVAMGRALVHNPRLLLLDEPLGALDALTRIEMHRLIEGLWRSTGFTALLVTHDVQEAVALADRVVLIEDGQIALDQRIDLPRPRVHGDAAFAQLEKRILDRVLQKPDPEPAAPAGWPGVPAHGLRWAV